MWSKNVFRVILMFQNLLELYLQSIMLPVSGNVHMSIKECISSSFCYYVLCQFSKH